MNLLSTLTFQIKARAGDWAVVRGKVELKNFGGGEVREEERGSTEEEVGREWREVHGLEKPQVLWGLIGGNRVV